MDAMGYASAMSYAAVFLDHAIARLSNGFSNGGLPNARRTHEAQDFDSPRIDFDW